MSDGLTSPIRPDPGSPNPGSPGPHGPPAASGTNGPGRGGPGRDGRDPSAGPGPGPDEGPDGAPTLGPILRYRGRGRDAHGVARVRLSVTLPPSAGSAAPAGARPLGHLAGTAFHAIDLDLPVSGGRARLPDVLLKAHRELPPSIRVPGPDEALRIAYTSCNGAEDEREAEAMRGGRNALWTRLLERHAAEPFHLLVMGGDQIYGDALWRLPTIRAWARAPARERLSARPDAAMRAELEAHYLATYARVFGAPELRAALASIPSVMMWDDHDIIDGWGSRPAGWQASPVAQAIFAAARRAFALVQAGVDPEAPLRPRDGHRPDGAHGFSWAGECGCARLVVPDLRSHRTRARVMAPDGAAMLGEAARGHGLAHTIVVSSVPLVNADLSAIERGVRPLWRLADLYQDDLRDQWMSHAHRDEWAGVVGELIDASAEARVSVLSGEIHLGAHGFATRIDGPRPRSDGLRTRSDGLRTRIEQFIASGIAHPPPPRALARAFEMFAGWTRARAGIAIDMRPLAPDGRRFVAERNWLEMTARPDGGLDATLHADEAGPLVLSHADAPLAGDRAA